MRRRSFVGVWLTDRAVLVHVEHADRQEHGQQAQHARPGGIVQRPGLHDGMRQQMQDRHTHHQPPHKTHHELHAGVGQSHDERQPAASQRGDNQATTVDRDQRCRPHERSPFPVEDRL